MDITTYALAKKQAVKEVPGLVDDWLEENVDPSTGYVLDNTLTLDNAAPPASAVGDLKSAIEKANIKFLFQNTYTIGNNKAVAISDDFLFKAGCVYVLIAHTGTYSGIKFNIGVSETDFEEQVEYVDGYTVLKYRPETDITAHFWSYNNTGSSKTLDVYIEEWNECGQLYTSLPNTVIVSASNSKWQDKYISKYISPADDAQPVLQQAINDLQTTGGEVLLCDGNYVITTLVDTEDSEVGLIALEITNPTVKHFIGIRGISKPIRDSTHEMKLGATLFVKKATIDALSNTQHVTVIGARPTDSEYYREPRALNVSIKNVAINIPTNQKPIKCIDLEYMSAAEIENVVIGITASGTMGTTPNAGCIGIRGVGGWNYGIYYIMRCVKILGMGVAFDIGGEHLLMEQCAVRYSDIPYRFYKYGDVSKMAHPQTLINCCEESCNKSLVFGANSNHPQVTLIDYNIEYRPTEHSGSWARTQKAVEETAGDINGEVTFTINKENYTNIADTDFWESGSGINFITRNSVDKKYGTTANRPTNPNLMQQYYDTTLSKLILFDGTNWIDAAANPFIVTLTPTAQDFSGVMDKTVAEITTAYQAGKQIVFKMYTSETSFIEVPVSLVGYDLSYTYPSFEASVIQTGNNLLIYAQTDVTDDETDNLYTTIIYTLTPMNA